MGKSMAGSLTAAVRRRGHGGEGCGDPGGHTASALESLYQSGARYRVGVGGVEFLTGGAATEEIIEYPDGSMAFNRSVW